MPEWFAFAVFSLCVAVSCWGMLLVKLLTERVERRLLHAVNELEDVVDRFETALGGMHVTVKLTVAQPVEPEGASR